MSDKIYKSYGLYWMDWRENPFSAWFELIVNSFNVIAILLLFIMYIRIFEQKKQPLLCLKNINFKDDNESRTDKKLRFFLLFSIILSIIHIWGFYWFGILSILVFNIRYTHNCFYMALTTVPTFAGQRMIVYIFLIKRLKITFDNTIYKLSDMLYYFFVTILVIIIPTFSGLIVYIAYQINSYKCVNEPESYKYKLVVGISGLLDAIEAIVLTSVFISKLKAVLDKRQDDRFQYVVKKLTLLTIIIVISSIIILTGGSASMSFQIIGLDLILNNICIMCSFAMFDYQYKKLCCCCISIQYKCCLYNKNIEHQMQNLHSNQSERNPGTSAVV